LNPVEKCLLDKSLVLDEIAPGEGFGLFVLLTMPDLPSFACKAEVAEDLELAFCQKRAVVLLYPDVVMAGYLRKHEMMVRVAILA